MANAGPAAAIPNDLESYWLPFTPNRAFKAAPRLIARAKDMHYYTPDGRAVLDGTAGLWCTNAGHNRDADRGGDPAQAAELDYAPAFQFAHPKAFELASRVADAGARRSRPCVLLQFRLGGGRHRAQDRARLSQCARRGRAHAPDRARARLSRRRLRRHLGRRHRHQPEASSARCSPASIICRRPTIASSRPSARASPNGARISPTNSSASSRCTTPSTIAAVIVEPMAGSTGVLPPPKGYLQRLRAICDKHGILLIFDEVITGFGRLGHAFAAERYGVTPDIITFAKGVTSGTVPMGGVIVRTPIHDAFMRGPEHVVELFHGYTYSAHPLACAAGLATLDSLSRGRPVRARQRSSSRAGPTPPWASRACPDVLDIRTVGLTAGIDLASRPGCRRPTRL